VEAWKRGSEGWKCGSSGGGGDGSQRQGKAHRPTSTHAHQRTAKKAPSATIAAFQRESVSVECVNV
jgi:hypothetical protein